MNGFRKFLSLSLILVGLVLAVLSLGSFFLPSAGEGTRVSQVFKQLGSVPLGPHNYLGYYDVALTPDSQGTAVLCHLYTFSPRRSIDLIEARAWLLQWGGVPFAYHESPHTRALAVILLATGILFWILAFPLYPPKEG